MHYDLPKKRLSYSQIDLWRKNKSEYRNRYYLEGKQIDSPEMDFGRKLSELLAANDSSVAFVPRYKTIEQELKLEIDGVPMLGYLDSFDNDTKAFYEYKTSHTDYWNAVTVHKHLQLDIYSLLVKEKHGNVKPYCSLFWIETEWGERVLTEDQQKLNARFGNKSRQLQFTGRIKEFKRRITNAERDAVRELITDTAKEISYDFSDWKTKHPAV